MSDLVERLEFMIEQRLSGFHDPAILGELRKSADEIRNLREAKRALVKLADDYVADIERPRNQLVKMREALTETRDQLVKVRDAIHAAGTMNDRDKYLTLGIETNTVISRALIALSPALTDEIGSK